MEQDDPFSRELRSARDRIAELQRRSGADPTPGDGLLPQVLAELDVAIEELSVTGEELREQTDELTATRRALEAERQRYQELFEAAPVAYLVTDPMARIREANRAAAALLGVAQGFLPGKPLAAYVDGSDRWGFRTMVNRLYHGEEQRVAGRPLRLRRRDGEVVRGAGRTSRNAFWIAFWYCASACALARLAPRRCARAGARPRRSAAPAPAASCQIAGRRR